MNDVVPAPDYRQSHLAKGPDYDDYVLSDPWSRYMTIVEHRILTRLVTRLFPDGLPASLDFACGTGRIASVMDARAARPVAVDVSDTMIAEARRKCARTTFVVQDLTVRDLDIEPVPLATAFRFFGNAEDPLRLAALEAIGRHLRPGGYLVFNNHRNPWAIQECLHRWTGGRSALDLDYAKLRGLLRRAGFDLVKAYGIGLWLILHRLARAEILDAKLARLLEPVSRLPLSAPFAPDLVILARKRP